MGQPMMQPMGQPMGGYQQPMGGYQQPMMGGGMNAFINSLKADYMKLIGFIGAIIIMISPFFNWMSMKVKYDGDSEKETYNMFKIADDGDVGIYLLFALLLIVVGVGLIIWDLADYVPALGALKFNLAKVPYIELILVGVAALVVILAFFNGDVKDAIDAGKEMIEFYEDWYGDDVSGHCNHGLGPIIALIGVAGAACPRVKKMMGR